MINATRRTEHNGRRRIADGAIMRDIVAGQAFYDLFSAQYRPTDGLFGVGGFLQAVENDVHIVGVSSLAAGHLSLVPALRAELKKHNREDMLVVVGGVIPPQDYEELKRLGATAIFGPGTVIAEAVLELLDILEAGPS